MEQINSTAEAQTTDHRRPCVSKEDWKLKKTIDQCLHNIKNMYSFLHVGMFSDIFIYVYIYIFIKKERNIHQQKHLT